MTAPLPAWVTRRPGWDLSPVTVGASHDRPGADQHVADTLEALGWTVNRATWTVSPHARLDGQPHPYAGETVPWAKCYPPGYDRTRDPVQAATARAVQATGNSDGAGRGASPYAGPRPVARTTHPRDLRTAWSPR